MECFKTRGQCPPPPPKEFMPYKNIEQKREYQREYVKRKRQKHIDRMGGKCVICGSNERLEVDHMDPAIKLSHRIWSWSEARILAEVSKCQLLCREHHQAKSLDEMNYPERQHGTNLMYMKAKCRCDLCKAAHAAVNRQYL